MLARAQELIEQAGKGKREFDWNITLQWSMFKREAEALGLTFPRSTRLDLPAR